MSNYKPYETIFLQMDAARTSDISWCSDRVGDGDVEYIRKDIFDKLSAALAREKELRLVIEQISNRHQAKLEAAEKNLARVIESGNKIYDGAWALIEEHEEMEKKLARVMPDNNGELREALSDLSHEIWAHWMGYLFDQCSIEIVSGKPVTIIPDDKCIRWRRQVETPYTKLSEREKDSDREQADKILAVFHETLERRPEQQ